MRRREFITILGGAAVWPVVARAQQPERMRRAGLLMSTGNPEDDPESRARISALREGLEKLGWTEGRNIELDYRWARGDSDRIQILAKELVALQPDLIIAVTTTACIALKRETTTIPVVFVNVVDPIGQKRVALYLRVSTSEQTTRNQRRALEAVAKRHGWQIVAMFEDDGISGAKGREGRPGLDALLKAVARREIDMVVNRH